MSSIPLPALSVAPPPDPLSEYAKIAGIKSMMLNQQNTQQEMAQRAALMPGQQQLQQAQITGAGQQNQIGAADVKLKDIQVKDQQLLSTLYPQFTTKSTPSSSDSSSAAQTSKPSGYDFDALKEAYIKGGGSMQGLSQINGIQSANAELSIKLAQSGEAQINQHQAVNSALNDAVETLQAIPDTDGTGQSRQQALAGLIPNLQKMGIDTSQFAQKPLTDKNLASFQATLGQHQQVVEDAQKLVNLQKAQLEAEQKSDPLKTMETNPSEMAGDKLPAAMAYLKSKISDPKADPVDKARATRLLSTAKMAQATQLAMDASKKATEQAIQDGNPNAAAKLLIDGTVAPSQLVSSRKPEFAQKAFSAAAALKPGWNAQKADADFKVASSPANVAFFGSAKSLTDKGGTLDQLKAAGDDIPQDQWPIFNSVDDALKASTGSGPIAKYAAIALGVADDYSKVMGGGNGSDTSRTQAIQLISAKQSPQQRTASIEGIRGSVGSQTKSRIGNNSVLQKMYGEGGAQGGGQTSSKAAPPAVGSTVTIKGKTMTVTAIHPDGSFDAK